MEHTIKINLEEVIEFKSFEEKHLLLANILSGLSTEEYSSTIKGELDDILQAEIEFDNRPNIVKALKLLIAEY
jgi:hypothetical protein